jgi:hypothetical protein
MLNLVDHGGLSIALGLRANGGATLALAALRAPQTLQYID